MEGEVGLVVCDVADCEVVVCMVVDHDVADCEVVV